MPDVSRAALVTPKLKRNIEYARCVQGCTGDPEAKEEHRICQMCPGLYR